MYIERVLQTTHTKPTSNLEVVYAGLTCVEEISSGFKQWILISQGKKTYTGFDLYEQHNSKSEA